MVNVQHTTLQNGLTRRVSFLYSAQSVRIGLSCFPRLKECCTDVPLTRHLIADHLGWFKDSTQEGTLKTVEDILRANGEKVARGSLDANGVVEYYK